ncbi:MAG TPA: cytochrome c-type biogenesis protein [Thermoanaerobaculia bacterium]|jgi:cytochrome c-type biogenesis protein CcmH
MTILLLLLLQLRVPDAAQFVGPPQGAPIAGDALTQRTHEVSELLRCPVCQGMSVADSPAEMAVNMKQQVRELLARGYTEEQILKYFELSYGEFVLLRPKSPVLWMLPIVALILGAAIVFVKLKKLEQPLPPTANRQPPTNPEPATPNDPYLDRVRDLVSGGKQ